MKKTKRLWNILKITKTDKILVGFAIFVLFISYMLMLIEPDMKEYGDALWYSFSVITTIGFGDVTAVTWIGRSLTMLMGLYGILVVALIPGIIVSYYLEFMQKKSDETIGIFLEKLENLDKMTTEELKQLSNKVKEKRYRLK